MVNPSCLKNKKLCAAIGLALTVMTGVSATSHAATLTVNSAADNMIAGDGLVTLREAVEAADTDGMTDLGQTGSGADTITFDSSLSGGTILLDGSEIEINSELTISGPGADELTIDAQGNSRIFSVNASGTDVTISGLTLTGGNAFQGAAILNNPGNLTLQGVHIHGNNATNYGGGIENKNIITITGSTISNNTAG